MENAAESTQVCRGRATFAGLFVTTDLGLLPAVWKGYCFHCASVQFFTSERIYPMCIIAGMDSIHAMHKWIVRLAQTSKGLLVNEVITDFTPALNICTKPNGLRNIFTYFPKK